MALYRKEVVLTTLVVISSYILREIFHDDSPAGIHVSESEEMEG